MPSCKIKVQNFQTLLNAVKDITESEKVRCGREILKYIQLEVSHEAIVATTCNGYQLSRFTLTQKNEEEFTCYFKPFYFRSFQWMADQDAVITLDSETEITTIKIPASFGTISYEFMPCNEKYPALPAEVLEKAKKDSQGTSTAFNPALLNISAKSFIKGRHPYMQLFTPADAMSPMYCAAKFSEEETLEHIILPVRNDR